MTQSFQLIGPAVWSGYRGLRPLSTGAGSSSGAGSCRSSAPASAHFVCCRALFGGRSRIDALDFLARVIAHIPPPRIHLVRYLGHYSNVSRGRRKKGKEKALTPGHQRDHEDDALTDSQRRARRRAWARLIRRIYEVDPLVCASCGGEMRIVSLILEHKVVHKILAHLERKGVNPGRDPPEPGNRLPKTV